jgi:protein-S-isoprenylcysteine O-methyltransferase Ste14
VVGYAGFLTAAFGWRTLAAKRSRGESGWREPVSRLDAFGETTCAVGCLATLLAPPLAAAGVVGQVTDRWPLPRGAAAVTLLAAGTVVAMWAQRHLAGEWRAGVEASESLVTTGPFARVRNPFYVGCFLAAASVLVAVPSTTALIGLVLHLVAAEVIVRKVEEPILSTAHGAAFARYRQRTGRFLPGLGR